MFSLTRRSTKKNKNTRKPVLRPKAEVTARPVQHERWIHVDHLELGMYVAELSIPWEETGFMFQGFEIDSARLLNQVKEASEYVLVRTEKVANVSSNSSNRLCRATRNTSSEWAYAGR